MSYRIINGRTKLRAVKAMIEGESITSVSKRMGVSRASLYNWQEVALKALEEYFQGELLNREKELRLRDKLEAGFGKVQVRLEKKIAARERQLENLAGQIRDLQDRGRPKKCCKCGCEKVYKNGFYSVSLDYFRQNLVKAKPGKANIRNFICASCGESISVVDPWRNQFKINKPGNESPPGMESQ